MQGDSAGLNSGYALKEEKKREKTLSRSMSVKMT